MGGHKTINKQTTKQAQLPLHKASPVPSIPFFITKSLSFVPMIPCKNKTFFWFPFSNKENASFVDEESERTKNGSEPKTEQVVNRRTGSEQRQATAVLHTNMIKKRRILYTL